MKHVFTQQTSECQRQAREIDSCCSRADFHIRLSSVFSSVARVTSSSPGHVVMAWERGGRRPLVALVLFLAMSSRVKADNMEVKRLQSTDGAQLSIYCATTNGIIPEETIDHYELSFTNPQNEEVTLTSTSEVLANPQVFDVDVQGLYGRQTLFVLTLKDSQSDKASIDMTFSLEDMSSVKATWVGTKEQGKPGSVLRLHGHGSDVLVCPAGEDKTGCLAFPSDANYREASDLFGATALVCARLEEDPTVPFCLAVADVTTSPAISYHSEIRLSYQEDQTAAPEGTLSVAMGIDSGDKRDLLYWADGNLYVCAGTSSCKIEAYPSSSDQYEVFFVDYQEADGEVSRASIVIPFIDFVVVGTVIGPDALEVRWKTNSHLQYKLSLTDNNGNDIETNPPPPFTSLVVHCASQEDCFGYFLELPAGDYKVMVRPWNGVDQIMSNSVLSSQQTIIQKSENKISDLEIQDVHFGWSSDGSKAFASACFTNRGGTPRSLRQFELVIADLKGHSIRSRGATQKADGAICFVGVTLLSDELIPGKVVAIVIERDFDGLSVVASASTEAFFKRTFDLTITQFEIVDETTKEFSIRYTGVSATVSGGELSAIKLEPEPVTEMDLALTGVSDTGANFVGTDLLMTWLQGQEPLKWVLRLTIEDGTTMFGEVEFLFPDISNFPKCDPGYLVGKQQMVRLDCNEQSLETDAILVGGDDLAIQASTGVKGVNYHLLNQQATSAAHIQLCRKAEDNTDVEICTRRSELKDATANAAAMTAIQVEYEATISVEQTPSDKKALDSLVYYYHNGPDSTTIKSCREPDVQNCPVPEYIGVEELEVLVVYVDDTKGKPVESEQRTVYGLELRGAQISDSLSEIAIKKMPDRNAYRVIVHETSQGTGVEAREPILNVKVTCENPSCYAYFSHLTAGVKYKATVSPYEDKEGTGNLDPMNQIVSLEMSTTQYRGKRGAANPKELILKQINRVKADTTKFSTDITVSNGANAIDGIASVTLIATHDNGNGTEEEYVAISQDVDSGTISPNVDQVYHFDINPADTILSPKTTLILIAKDAGNVPLALAEATVELQTINPTMSWVGGEDTAPLRVSTDQKLEINEIEFDAGTSYSLDFDAAAAASPVELCVTLENTAPAGGTVRQCDLTQSIQNVEHTKVEKIELQSEEGEKSDMTVWSTFKAMEVVLYNEKDTGIVPATFSCNTTNVCTSDISSQIPGLEQVFKVLVVGVTETDVPWADVVDFENFQTRVQRISESDVEVRWEASEMLDFNVHLENNNQDGFAIVPVQCGGADLRNCKAYFTKLEADTPYKAGVMKDNTVVSISVPTTAGTTPPLAISRLTKVSKHPAQMKLTFSAEVEVAGIEYVEYVVIDPPVDNTAMQHIIFKATNEIINVGENEISFDEAELPDSGEGATVLVIVHGPDGAASDALAAGKVVGTFKAINPTMSWVGGVDTAPLRVSTDQKLEINGTEFDNGTSYSLDFDAAAAASPVEVCVTLENTAPAGATVRQCDLTQSIQSVGELTIDKIELNYDGGKNFMTVSSTFAEMEAVLYDAGGRGIMPMTYSCVAEDTKTCSSFDIIDHISSLEPAFKVLVVGVDAETVTGSKVADFEDFKVRVQRFSDAGDLEVRWRASSNQSFEVHLDNEVPDGFTSVSAQCGGAEQAENRACKAYFTKLKPDTTYKAQLERENTVVSATVPAITGSYTPVTIPRIAEMSKSPSEIQFTISAAAEVAGIEYVEYVVIDPPVDNAATQHIIFEDTNENINEGDNVITLETELPNVGAEGTVLVVVHGSGGVDSDALAAGRVTVAFAAINPTMSWVGGEDTAPLRVSTDQRLEINGIGFDNGTSYSLDFDAAAAASPVEVCVTLENAAPAGGTVRQCDLTQSIQSVGELAIDKIELNYDGGKNFMTVSSTFAGMEAVLYNAGGRGIMPMTYFCVAEDTKTCSSVDIIDHISSLEPAFKVLVVGVEAETVKGSKVADFEDFKVRVQRFSDAGDLEVRWRASSNQSFEVHLDNEVPEGFTSVSAQCGGAENRACKAYFTKLKPDTTYKAQLERENTVVSATVPAAPGPYTPATITRITEMSKFPSEIQFTISATAEVTGIEYVEYVVIDPPVDNMATQHIIFKKTNENITVGDNVITFDTELPNVGAEGTVLVVVHGSGGVDSDALAAAKVVVTFEVINPTMTWVGGQNTAPVRIKSSQDLTVNGDACDAGTSYSLVLDASAAPPELCVALENTAAGGTVWQCDVTQSIQNTDELTIDKIELNYDDGKNFMTVSSTFAGMEAVLYNAGGSGIMPMTYSCVAEDTKTCSSVDIIDHISSLEPAFKVLVVGVEAETVTGAKVADFEDFKVRVQRFSDAGDLEVRWRASSDQSFKVHLDNEVPDGFTSVSLQCGGAENRACKAYFTKLKPDTTYKVQLEKDNTIVSATVPATPGHSTAIHITQIAKASLDPLQTQLTVTADTEVMGMEYVEYVMIDLPSGDESTQYIVFKDMHGVINVDNSITFDVEQVPNTGVEVTILFIVHRKDGVDSDALAAGKVALTFEEIKPKMNWVGGTSKPPLRIQTTQELEVNGIHVDKGTFYFLDFDGSVSAPEVCVTRETIVPAGGTVKQCDMTLTKGNVPDMDVNKIELNHEEDKSTMTVYSTFTNMEAVLYDADDRGKVSESFSCDTENVCSSDVTTTLSGLETAFKVLAVGVDGQSDVTGAKLVDFEDLQTRAQKFGDAGDVEVRWRTSTPQQFNVSLENDVDDGYTNVSVECGGAEKAGNRACKAYYTKLKPGKTYKAEVKKDIAVVSASVTSTSGSVQALSITRISEVSKAPRQTQLTITAEEEVTGIEYLEYVMIDPPEGGEATEHIAINDTTDTIGVGNTTVTFSETDEPIMYEEETLLVLAHGPDTNILASGKVLMYFADLEPPKMTKVGSEELQSLKVETSDLDAKVNGELCRAKSVCYFLESEILEPPEVCRGGEPFVEQCDMTGSYILPKNLINPMVDLKYSGIPQEELTVTAEFDAASVSMEAMIYSDDGIDTSTPLTCNIKGKECVFTVVPPRPLFKILLMALNHQADVVESHATKFEDFQTRAEQVMDGTVEVSWKASQTMVYIIEIRPPPETSYSNTTVFCGGENPEDSKNCMAYFMGLNPGEGYTVYVTKEVDGSQSVSAFVQLETRDFSSPITITTVKKNADKRPSLSVCFKDELLAEGKSSEGVTETRNLKYSLAVVNPLGQQLHSTLDLSSLSSHSNLEDDLCFSALSLGLDFDVRQKVWVFVKREGKSDGRVGAAGDVEVSLLAEIAEVSEVKAKATGFDKILVTWQKPEDEDDVSSYVITWTKASPSSKASLTDRSIQPRPRQPLPLIAQGFRESEQEQRVVPASYPSAEVLHLDPSQVYEVCVSAVRRGVEGGRMCDVNDLGKYDPVQSPTDLVFEDDLLKWKEVTSASGYLVEWRPRQEGVYSGGQAEVRTPSWHAGSLSPGRWVVSVRATTDTSASKPESAEYLRNGIEIVSAVQSKNNQLVLQWREEPEPPCAESTCNYTITTSRNKGPTWHSCSGLKDGCEKAVRVEGGSQVEVILERGGLRTSVKERVYRFPEVSGLSQRFAPGDKEVTMSWAEVEEAKLYNVTLYTDSTLSSIRFTAMISKESLNLRENNMTGNVLVIQPCADKDHCGNCQNITLMAIADSPSSITPVVAASVVGGVLLVVAVVFLVVVVKTIMKRREDEDTSPLEEVGGVPPMSAQQSAHSVAHRVIPLSTLSLQENKQE